MMFVALIMFGFLLAAASGNDTAGCLLGIIFLCLVIYAIMLLGAYIL